MTIQSHFRSSFLSICVATISLAGGLAQAQEAELIDAARDEVELRADVRDAIERDTDVANTALVFNNTGRRATLVRCTAYDGNGNVLGRKSARVPSQGVRYLRASDLADGADFVGSALCRARGHVAASAIFLAPGAITDVDVIRVKGKRATRLRFPLVASY